MPQVLGWVAVGDEVSVGGGVRVLQSVQSVPKVHTANSLPVPPSSQSPSLADEHVLLHRPTAVPVLVSADGAGDGGGMPTAVPVLVSADGAGDGGGMQTSGPAFPWPSVTRTPFALQQHPQYLPSVESVTGMRLVHDPAPLELES